MTFPSPENTAVAAPGVSSARRTAALLAVLLCAATAALAAPDPDHIRFDRITAEDGLSQSYVQAMLQDRQGFLWIGTQVGLNRFDGYRFTVLNASASDPDSLSHDFVEDLAEGDDGSLWIATAGGGLDRLHPLSGRFSHHRHDPERPDSLASDEVRTLLVDRRGFLWVGTVGAGLDRLDPESGRFRHFPPAADDPASLPHGVVTALLEDSTGSLWIGTQGGLARLDPVSGVVWRFGSRPGETGGLDSTPVRSLHEDRLGRIWIGTYRAGLTLFDPRTGRATTHRHDPADPGSIGSGTVRAIFEDHAGTVWVGTDAGISLRAPGDDSFAALAHDPADPRSLSSDTVSVLMQDRGGVLWVGTHGGLNRWSSAVTGTIPLYRPRTGRPDSLSGAVVTSFAEAPDGGVWVGLLGRGLDRLGPEREGFRHVSLADRLGDARADQVGSVLVDRRGELWIGTYAAGLIRADAAGEPLARFRHAEDDPRSLGADAIPALLEDRRGRLWVGTYGGGLHRLDRSSGTFDRFQPEPGDPTSLSSDRVVDLAEGRDGTLWIVTHDAGLNAMDPASGAIRRYRERPGDPASLPTDQLYTVLEDRRGDLWLGTESAGLARWRHQDRAAGRVVFTSYGKDQGLPSNSIYGVLEGDDGRLWLSSNRGLARFDPRTGAVQPFDPADGLQGLEFTHGATLRLSDGTLLFGGDRGFNAVEPWALRHNPYVPPVVITAVEKASGRAELAQQPWRAEHVDLGPSEDGISFEFAALDFSDPERNRYRYRLEGFEDDWVDAGSRHRATYTSLPAGRYTFRVQGASSQGVWNEAGATIALAVRPPFWRSAWAYSLYVLVLGGALSLVVRAQHRKLRRAEEIRRSNEVLSREIRQRKEKEAALEREKRRAQRYLDVVEVIMLALDPDGRVTLINQKGCRVLGRREEEILGRDWFEEFVPAAARAEARSSLGGEKPYEYSESPVLSASGEEHIIAWHSACLRDEDGAPAGTLSSGTDITHTRALEKQLQNRHKMDAIGTLAGGVAHDFNNILAAILGYSALAYQDLRAESEVADHIRQVTKAAERAKELVSRLLDFSRRGSQAKRTFRVQDEIDDALDLVRPSLPESVEIRRRIDPACEPIVADPTQISQVIVNLCTNALHAMRETGGVLELSLGMEEIGPEDHSDLALAPGRHVKLAVRDTGHGMEQATVDRMFDPFFTTKEVGEGTGLGLSAVHGIVKGSRGDVRVVSAPRRGTTVEVYLPCPRRMAAPAAQSAASTEGDAGERANILYVDDDAAVANLVARMLERSGYAVTASTDSREALELLRRERGRWDLLVTDDRMPGLSGIDLAKAAHRDLPELPVILVSGYSNRSDETAAIAAFLRKPFSPTELTRAVRRTLDGAGEAGREAVVAKAASPGRASGPTP